MVKPVGIVKGFSAELAENSLTKPTGFVNTHMQEASMQGKVEICGVNTARLKVLSQVEMDALLLQAKAGDASAREKLIEGNLRLVLSVIQRFEKRGESPDDLFQVGCIGLMKAIANFDPTKQVRFSTYGVPMTCECGNNIIIYENPCIYKGFRFIR